MLFLLIRQSTFYHFFFNDEEEEVFLKMKSYIKKYFDWILLIISIIFTNCRNYYTNMYTIIMKLPRLRKKIIINQARLSIK